MNRWVIVLGRGGTVLIAISLALIFVSLLPVAQMGSSKGGGGVGPNMFQTFSEYVLTPQQGLEVTITANGTLTVYILEVQSQTIYDWIGAHYSEHESLFYDYNNVTRLEDFLEANPDSTGLQKELREETINYVPTKVTNATLVFSNPRSDLIQVSYEASIQIIVAPGTKLRYLAQWTIPIGFVLAVPWLTHLWKQRTKRLRQTS
jgi:hypothetical protein